MPAPTARYSAALNRFVWLTAGATLFLICSGGMVTSKGVGLAVPDWPTTFGYNMFLFPVSKWVGGIFFEHTHRLVASVVGLLTIVLTFWLWRSEQRRWLRLLWVAALGAVVLQGVLGGLRVTLLKDEIGIFHACLAQAFLGLLVVIGLATSKTWSNAVRRPLPSSVFWLPALTAAVIYLQLGLGATMRHQHRDLAILDFPAAYGRVLPDLSPETLRAINTWREAQALSDVTAGQIWLQMAHRLLALVIAVGIVGSWFAIKRAAGAPSNLITLSRLWIFLLVSQITLGAWTIWSNKAADIATAHVAVGATILAFGISIAALAVRYHADEHTTTAARNAVVPQEVHSL